MKYITIIAFITFTLGCNSTKNKILYKPTAESVEREKLSDKVIAKVAKQLKQDKNLLPCGSGGRISEGVKMLASNFFYRKPITIEQGRELLISSVQEFIKAVNEEEHIKPYLKNYPFEAKNIAIRIFLQNPDGSLKGPGLHVLAACEECLKI